MKSWQDSEILINDYRNALIEQNDVFSQKILSFLNMGATYLIKELHDHPAATLHNKHGDWMYLWKTNVKIDGELYNNETIINRIEKLLNKELK